MRSKIVTRKQINKTIVKYSDLFNNLQRLYDIYPLGVTCIGEEWRPLVREIFPKIACIKEMKEKKWFSATNSIYLTILITKPPAVPSPSPL